MGDMRRYCQVKPKLVSSLEKKIQNVWVPGDCGNRFVVSSQPFNGVRLQLANLGRCLVPKYLIQAAYTAEGLQGLIKDRASGRRAAVGRALEAIGGKIESIYYTFGDYDVILIADIPDNVSAAAMSIRVSGSGLVRTKTTPLLTVEETDLALGRTVAYRPPGG